MIEIENLNKTIIATLEEVDTNMEDFITTIPVERGMIIEIKKEYVIDLLKLLNKFNVTLHEGKDDDIIEFLVSKKQDLNQILDY